ncbi:MAG: helix-turn-helix domain-containing protein [Pyrinomonadaceae bacterium]
MAGRPAKKKASESGQRLAAWRQEAGLSQVKLARILGIPQRTLSFYEREAEAIPSSLVPAMAKTLGVTIEEILGLERPGQKKRGPQSQLERQLAAIATLPRKEQQQLLAVVQAFVNQHAEQ